MRLSAGLSFIIYNKPPLGLNNQQPSQLHGLYEHEIIRWSVIFISKLHLGLNNQHPSQLYGLYEHEIIRWSVIFNNKPPLGLNNLAFTWFVRT